ncbi:MAG: hypothetical protein JJ913_04405 [Rhizobiaceae bacterium]|nr:hypothetical protein [Rhizobiaceae bacterium]
MKKWIAALALSAGIAPAAVQAQQPIITDIHWPYVSSYCTFMRAGQNFDYNDLESWRFVYFDNTDTITGSNARYAYIGLHHQLRQLEEMDTMSSGEGELRKYRTWGEPSYEVTVSMLKGDGGYESTSYTGTISVSGPGGQEEIEFHGECGV